MFHFTLCKVFAFRCGCGEPKAASLHHEASICRDATPQRRDRVRKQKTKLLEFWRQKVQESLKTRRKFLLERNTTRSPVESFDGFQVGAFLKRFGRLLFPAIRLTPSLSSVQTRFSLCSERSCFFLLPLRIVPGTVYGSLQIGRLLFPNTVGICGLPLLKQFVFGGKRGRAGF